MTELIQKYLDGLATDAETAELGEGLAASPRLATQFALMSRLDGTLAEQCSQARSIRTVDAFVRSLPTGKLGVGNRKVASDQHRVGARFRAGLRGTGARRMLVAAAVLVAVVGGLIYFLIAPESGVYAVETGRVLVDGVESRQVRAGAEVEVLGDQSAVIHLPRGGVAELAPTSKAIIYRRVPSTGQVVALSEGCGEFRVQDGPDRFHVETPLGKISGGATQFFVGLRPAEKEGESLVARQVAALIVAVIAGDVRVSHGDRNYALGRGDNRVYAGNRPGRAPDFSGKVIQIGPESIVLESLPASKDARPERRVVELTEQTRLSYNNVTLRGEKPTVGYRATVWLEADSSTAAAAVTFRGNKVDAPRPDFMGKVTEIAADAKAITLELPAKKKGEAPVRVRLNLDEHTKRSYALVPFYEERPTVGYFATVWLKAGSKDTAASAVFRGSNGNLPAPELSGTVSAVAKDGREISLRLPAVKGRPARVAVVKLGERSRLVYVNLEKPRQKPAVGLNASVWLEKGSKDVAAGIRLAGPPPKKPDAETAAANAFFAVPAKVQLNDGQKQAVQTLIKEMTPRYRALAQKKSGILKEEQKRALAVTQQAVKEAGLTDARQIRLALDAGAGINAGQRQQLDTVAREENALRGQYVDRIRELLSKEQAAQLQPAPPPRNASSDKPALPVRP
jgi:hypothetical protein